MANSSPVYDWFQERLEIQDIADDIGGQNYTLRHLNERVTIYNEENFKYEVIKINLRAN